MKTVKERILKVQENIAQICRRSGRNPDEVTLVAITKNVPIEKVREAIACGVKHIGENRVQDAEGRFHALAADLRGLTRHMVGHLQTNKVKDAVKIFDMIQSADSIKLLGEIEKRVAAQGRPSVDILIEVNSGEEQKTGVTRADVPALVNYALSCGHIRLKGLMTMAPLTEDTAVIRKAFRELRILGEKMSGAYKSHPRFDMKYLSMGMTDDYEIALEEGATMVRLGRAIFKD